MDRAQILNHLVLIVITLLAVSLLASIVRNMSRISSEEEVAQMNYDHCMRIARYMSIDDLPAECLIELQ